MPQAGMNEISSASVEVLTSTSLMPLRDLSAGAICTFEVIRIDDAQDNLFLAMLNSRNTMLADNKLTL